MDERRISNDPVTPEKRAFFPECTRRKHRKTMREWLVALAAALLIATVLRATLFTVIRVDGKSMYPTLENRERLLVTLADVRLGGVHRGDVVICRYPGRRRTLFVKRVVAVPGDSVYRAEGVTHVLAANDPEADTPLDPNRHFYRPEDDYEPVVLGESEYFVVGDNRYRSHDSRNWRDSRPSDDVGPITRDMIVGRVRQVVWPPKRIRPVK